MAERVIHFSDFSDAMMTDPDQIAEMVVLEHPDIEQPVKLEAQPDEISQVGKLAMQPVICELKMPGEEEPTRYVFTSTNFNKLAGDKPMKEVLAGATPFVAEAAKKRAGGNGDPRERWGLPKKGKTSPEEGEWVRANLELVNQRRAEQGVPLIDPTNTDHARRYGFGTLEASQSLPDAS